MTGKPPAATVIAAVLACLAGSARAEAPGKPRPAKGPTAAEFEELKKRVDEQNDLIMKLTQMEGEHFEFLLKLIQNSRPGGVAKEKQKPDARPKPDTTATDAEPKPQPLSTDRDGPALPERKVATISGRVDIRGKTWGSVYVYVDNIKEPAIDRSVEIVQKDRAFVPNVLVVQKGTRISFPNADPFLHNVFSPSPTSPFDLGTYRQGENPGAVRLFTPGVVEVLCNMHAKMRANVLVVPNRYHVKVGADGSFRLDNVPVGARQVVAWTPDARPMTESVMLTPAGASVRFALQVEAAPPPLDKSGKPRP